MKCPLCFTFAGFFLSADRREYWLCPGCRLIFVPPRYFLSEEQEIERYLQHENSLDNAGYVKMFSDKIKLIRQACPEVVTVLDFGCGYEPVLKTLLANQGYNVDVYDANFFPDRRLKGNYDLIISTETFEHFKEPGKEIEKIKHLLAPSGFLAVMTRLYTTRESSSVPDGFEEWYYKRDLTHVSFYCTETFSWIAAKHGFNLVFSDPKDFIILRKGK